MAFGGVSGAGLYICMFFGERGHDGHSDRALRELKITTAHSYQIIP